MANTSCQFDATDSATFPFVFYQANGSKVTTGVPVSVSGYSQPVCVFNSSACNAGGAASCCEATNQINNASEITFPTLLFFFVPYMVSFCPIFGVLAAYGQLLQFAPQMFLPERQML